MDYSPHMECVRKHNLQSDYKSLENASQITSDIEASMTTAQTSEVMNVCKIRIIGPFNYMLTMVGWRSLITQYPCSEKFPLLFKILDKALLLLLISLVIFSYVYQILACRFTMNSNDKIMTIGPHLTTLAPKNSSVPFTKNLLLPSQHNSNDYEIYMQCNHAVTNYAIPNIIHFVAFILGMIHYRYRENEDIYGLMEKTTQYSATLGIRKNNYFIVSKMMTILMVMTVFWVFLSIVNHILYDIIYNTYTTAVYIFQIKPSDDSFTSNVKHFLFFLDFLGYCIMSLVTAIIVLNYAIYCELVKFYVDAISKKIETRRIKLNVLRNDIDNVSGYICLINGMIGKMTSLIFFMELNFLIVGINNIFQSGSKITNQVAFRFYYILHLLPLIITALTQCVRVNHAMKTFTTWGRHMSVFGYRKETKKELDSFLLFTMGFNSKVRLMAIPLEWWHLVIFSLFMALVFVISIQTGALDNVPIFKEM